MIKYKFVTFDMHALETYGRCGDAGEVGHPDAYEFILCMQDGWKINATFPCHYFGEPDRIGIMWEKEE